MSSNWCSALKLSPDGRRLYVSTVSPGSQLYCYDVKSGELLHSVPVHGPTDFTASMVPHTDPDNGHEMVLTACCGGNLHEVALFDATLGEVVWQRKGGAWPVGNAWDARRQRVVLSCHPGSGNIRCMPGRDPDEQGLFHYATPDAQWITALRFAGERLFAAGHSPVGLRVYNRETGQPLDDEVAGTDLAAVADKIRQIEVYEGRDRLFAHAGQGRGVLEFELSTLRLVREYPCETKTLTWFQASADGLLAVVAGKAAAVDLFDTESGEKLGSVPLLAAGTELRGLAVSGRHVYAPYYSPGAGGGVLIVEAPPGSEPRAVQHPTHRHSGAACLVYDAPRRSALCSFDTDDIYRVSPATGAVLGRLEGFGGGGGKEDGAEADAEAEAGRAASDEVREVLRLGRAPGGRSSEAVGGLRMVRDGLLFVHVVRRVVGPDGKLHSLSVLSFRDPATGAHVPGAWPAGVPSVLPKSEVAVTSAHICVRTEGATASAEHNTVFCYSIATGELVRAFDVRRHFNVYRDKGTGQNNSVQRFDAATLRGYTFPGGPDRRPARLFGELRAEREGWDAVLARTAESDDHREQHKEFGADLRGGGPGVLSGSLPGAFDEAAGGDSAGSEVLAVAVRISCGNALPALGWGHNVLLVFDIETGQLALKTTTAQMFWNAKTLRIAGEHLCAGLDRGSESRALVYSLRTGALWARCGRDELGQPAAFEPGSRPGEMYVGSGTGAVTLWRFEPETNAAAPAALLADEEALAAAYPEKCTKESDSAAPFFARCHDAELVESYDEHSAPVCAVVPLGGGARLLSAGTAVVGRSAWARTTLGLRLLWRQDATTAGRGGPREAITRWLGHYGPVLEFVQLLLLLLLDVSQVAGFAFSLTDDEAWQPEGDVFDFFRDSQLVDIGGAGAPDGARFAAAALLPVALVAILYLQEFVEWALVKHPTRLRTQLLWAALDFAARLLAGSAFLFAWTTLGGVLKCDGDDNVESADGSVACDSASHVALVACAAVALVAYLPLVLRHSLGVGELASLDVRANPFDWSGDRPPSDDAEPAHPLVQQGASYGLSLLACKLVVTAFLVYLDSEPAVQAAAELVSSLALVLALLFRGPYPSRATNAAVAFLYSAVVVTNAVGLLVVADAIGSDDATDALPAFIAGALALGGVLWWLAACSGRSKVGMEKRADKVVEMEVRAAAHSE